MSLVIEELINHKFCRVGLIPVVLFVIFVYVLNEAEPLTYNNYVFGSKAIGELNTITQLQQLRKTIGEFGY